jgi:uncharacterized membrane protein
MSNFTVLYQNLLKRLPHIYLLYAVPMVFITALITPPFQSPDEPNHFARAEQVSRLELIPAFTYDKAHSLTKADSISSDPKIAYPDKGGFTVDKGIYALDHAYVSLEHNAQVKLNTVNTNSAKSLRWKTGNIYFNFGNTAIYPPVVYVMQSLGIDIGKFFNLSIQNTLYISRILNGLISIAMCFIALCLAKRSRILLFVVLLFPMTVSLFASVSQDAVLISCCFLLTAIIDSVEFSDDKVYSQPKLYTLIILMAIIGLAKPPYILFAFLFLFLKLSPKQKAIGTIIPFSALIFWLIINHGAFMIKFAPPEMRFNSKLQVQHILQHPFQFIGMFFNFDKANLLNIAYMFVGVLGWLDLRMPDRYYMAAFVCLFLAGYVGINFKGNIKIRAVLIICSVATVIAVITAQYVTWVALASTSLGGMQGRYLIPVYPFLALAFCAEPGFLKNVGFKTVILSIVLLFPVYTAVIMVHELLGRYY